MDVRWVNNDVVLLFCTTRIAERTVLPTNEFQLE